MAEITLWLSLPHLRYNNYIKMTTIKYVIFLINH